jgi:hypothetical protein
LGFQIARKAMLEGDREVPDSYLQRPTVERAPQGTMQMLVSLTDTSNPAKWSILRFSF